MIITMFPEINPDEAYINMGAANKLIDFMLSEDINDNNIEDYIERLIDEYYQDSTDIVKGRAKFLLAGVYVGVALICTRTEEELRVEKESDV